MQISVNSQTVRVYGDYYNVPTWSVLMEVIAVFLARFSPLDDRSGAAALARLLSSMGRHRDCWFAFGSMSACICSLGNSMQQTNLLNGRKIIFGSPVLNNQHVDIEISSVFLSHWFATTPSMSTATGSGTFAAVYRRLLSFITANAIVVFFVVYVTLLLVYTITIINCYSDDLCSRHCRGYISTPTDRVSLCIE